MHASFCDIYSPKAEKKKRNKRLKKIWMCCNCRARIKRITGEEFEKPNICECGSKDFV